MCFSTNLISAVLVIMLASLACCSFKVRVTVPELKAIAEVFEDAGFIHAMDSAGADEDFVMRDARLDGRLKGLAVARVNQLSGVG